MRAGARSGARECVACHNFVNACKKKDIESCADVRAVHCPGDPFATDRPRSYSSTHTQTHLHRLPDFEPVEIHPQLSVCVRARPHHGHAGEAAVGIVIRCVCVWVDGCVHTYKGEEGRATPHAIHAAPHNHPTHPPSTTATSSGGADCARKWLAAASASARYIFRRCALPPSAICAATARLPPPPLYAAPARRNQSSIASLSASARFRQAAAAAAVAVAAPGVGGARGARCGRVMVASLLWPFGFVDDDKEKEEEEASENARRRAACRVCLACGKEANVKA